MNRCLILPVGLAVVLACLVVIPQTATAGPPARLTPSSRTVDNRTRIARLPSGVAGPAAQRRPPTESNGTGPRNDHENFTRRAHSTEL